MNVLRGSQLDQSEPHTEVKYPPNQTKSEGVSPIGHTFNFQKLNAPNKRIIRNLILLISQVDTGRLVLICTCDCNPAGLVVWSVLNKPLVQTKPPAEST